MSKDQSAAEIQKVIEASLGFEKLKIEREYLRAALVILVGGDDEHTLKEMQQECLRHNTAEDQRILPAITALLQVRS